MPHGNLAARNGTNARHWSRFVGKPGLMPFSDFTKDHFYTSEEGGKQASMGHMGRGEEELKKASP